MGGARSREGLDGQEGLAEKVTIEPKYEESEVASQLLSYSFKKDPMIYHFVFIDLVF